MYCKVGHIFSFVNYFLILPFRRERRKFKHISLKPENNFSAKSEQLKKFSPF